MRFDRHFLRRAFLVILVLFVASCSGGGCSSGCSQCGTAPLPGGFPKPQTSPNSATIRVTRPGMNFLQENLGLLAEKALGTSAPGGVASFSIPKSSQAGVATICTPAAPKSPQCEAQIDIAKAKLRINAITPNKVKIDGLLPVRISDLPIQLIGIFNAAVVAGDATQAPGGDLCSTAIRGKPNFPFKEFPLNVELPLVTETRIPRNGYTKVDVDKAVIDIAITKNDVEICDNTCGGACSGALDFVKDLAFNTLIGGIKDQVKSALTGAFCTQPTPTVTPPCPTGSKPDNADLKKATKCVFDGTQECVPALLGADGRMDLSKALIQFSPGTVGGLDFVLASAGDLNPAPGEATLPAWTPRKPPVPAEDNNKNGLSLTMLGGALPQPQSSCVTKVDSIRPENIPIPVEMTGDTIPNWPAGTAGPHVGFSLAGRYLDHALAAAYNSGLLCLGIGTEQVEQLSTGYLSILAPSINTLTFQGRPSAAAISTRPGKPPKAKIGNGTDIKTDPLLLINLERFAIDFYVWSQERFVRLFTYTADVTVPVNLQTGKDAKNPNGGILPVLGDIKLANASVTNADLLLDDPNAVGNGVTGLVGGIVGQFLGGGFNPIDLQGALSSFGLGIEIPQGGIRKLTSGTDDFLAIFANLTKAAPTATQEVETRATLVEKIVDPGAMGLSTAVRARFPKLRVRAEGVATKPTEQTWWVDDGPHAAWTRSNDLVVDADAMLLQGRHTLYVSSRVVGEMATEDSTPVAIPFVIDTLAPDVDIARSGKSVKVRALDYVSATDALVARKRVDGGAWSEWAPVADLESFSADEKAVVEVEVKDEEGNVGRVSSPLIRGKADSTLSAAGSGCGCTTAGGDASSRGVAGISASLVVAAALLSRRRRAAGR
ncbi:MAG: hypothetical protein JST00_40710 [Deltaproteobacteria bacterium]|nr:hypothetical protein [Deltaproteobacteria bacterium]